MALNVSLMLLLLNLLVLFPNIPKISSDSYGDIDDPTCFLGFDNYKDTCPEAEAIIFTWVEQAVMEDSRMAASLLRLHFHDCFVNGCDASVLLDDNANFVGEKTAAPNLNSLRGFEVIDAIKSDLESVCPQTVSCADILATVARDSVVLVFLIGAHTLGKARCPSFVARLQGTVSNSNPMGPTTPQEYFESLQQLCSGSDSSTTLADLDLVTPATFDNQYFVNLLSGEGLLPSDQVLMNEDVQTRELVELYAEDPFGFFEDFKNSMLKMGSLGALTGTTGEIRMNCRSVN